MTIFVCKSHGEWDSDYGHKRCPTCESLRQHANNWEARAARLYDERARARRYASLKWHQKLFYAGEDL